MKVDKDTLKKSTGNKTGKNCLNREITVCVAASTTAQRTTTAQDTPTKAVKKSPRVWPPYCKRAVSRWRLSLGVWTMASGSASKSVWKTSRIPLQAVLPLASLKNRMHEIKKIKRVLTAAFSPANSFRSRYKPSRRTHYPTLASSRVFHLPPSIPSSRRRSGPPTCNGNPACGDWNAGAQSLLNSYDAHRSHPSPIHPNLPCSARGSRDGSRGRERRGDDGVAYATGFGAGPSELRAFVAGVRRRRCCGE